MMGIRMEAPFGGELVTRTEPMLTARADYVVVTDWRHLRVRVFPCVIADYSTPGWPMFIASARFPDYGVSAYGPTERAAKAALQARIHECLHKQESIG